MVEKDILQELMRKWYEEIKFYLCFSREEIAGFPLYKKLPCYIVNYIAFLLCYIYGIYIYVIIWKDRIGCYIYIWKDRIGAVAIIVCLISATIYYGGLYTGKDTTTNVEKVFSDSAELHEMKDVQEIKGIERLIQNLKQLLLEGHNSDVILNAGHHEFRVHKAILAARSPVFASMFQQIETQGPIHCIDIPDYSAETFKIFLFYLYTGATESLSSENVFSLYRAAEKYEIGDLKDECLLYMINFLSVDNFCDVMALSLHHRESKLQKVATRFFSLNIKEIIKTVQWEKFLSENASQANELLKKALAA